MSRPLPADAHHSSYGVVEGAREFLIPASDGLKLESRRYAPTTSRAAAAFDTLLAAERDVAEEVRYRPWSQQLTRDLLSAPASYSLSDVRDFAARIGVA